jgi:hypothetical protein
MTFGRKIIDFPDGGLNMVYPTSGHPVQEESVFSDNDGMEVIS